MSPEIGILRLTVHSAPAEPRAGEPIRWTFTISNIGAEPCRLTFTSGQQGDVVLDADGAERYRWSSDKYFTAAITEREVPALAELTFELEDVLSVEPGTYSLRASVKSRPAPPPVRTEIVVAP